MSHKIVRVEVKTLVANNIRSSLGEEIDLLRLRDSLLKGQKSPIETSGLIIIDGHRRVAAAELGGITHLDAIDYGDLTPEEITYRQTVRAFHSESLSVFDQANTLKAKKDASEMGNTLLAEHFDIDKSRVTQLLSLFDCIPSVQELAAQGKIGHTKWYDISRSHDQEETLRLHLAGDTRDEMRKKAKRAKQAAVPTIRTNKIEYPIAGGGSVIVKADGASLEDAGEYLKEALKAVNYAISKSYNAKTAQSMWKDAAAAAG